MHTISKVCLQILKPETPYVLDTISKDYTSTTTTDWELDKSHWINVIAQLQLSNLQVGAAGEAGGGAGRGQEDVGGPTSVCSSLLLSISSNALVAHI